MEHPATAIWEKTQTRLQEILNPELYSLWFAPIRAVSLSEGEITLGIPNDFFEAWLTENYLGLLRDFCSQSAGQALRIRFEVIKCEDAPEPTPSVVNEAPGAKEKRSLPFTAKSVKGAPRFNPNYTFDNFVVGENANHAFAAAMAVAKSPGKSYNPLFLYGGTGLGKTHLLQAIGHAVVEKYPRKKVVFVSSEKFTNEYIDALQNNNPNSFRKKYRQQDLLLIDDIQFLKGKERIQEEFFHTFNALHESRRQIVLASDRPINELKGLEQRLISRFEWGLVADVQPPDMETRIAILMKKADALNKAIPEDVLQFIATRIRSNVRRLEGALIRVVSMSTLTGRPISLENSEKALSDLLHDEERVGVTIDMIQKKVCEHFDIRLADMSSRRRPESIAFPRQIAMYLARDLTNNSLSAIGEAFGGRDHGTVIHACRTVRDRAELDQNVRETVNYLKKHLQR